MPKRRSAKMSDLEARITKALDAIQKKEVKNVYEPAKRFKVNRETLRLRVNGGLSLVESHESTQLLSVAEENALVLWCKRLSAAGFPPRHQLLKEMAWEILTCRVASINTNGMQLITHQPIGQAWTKRFVQRHPEVKTVNSEGIDLNR